MLIRVIWLFSTVLSYQQDDPACKTAHYSVETWKTGMKQFPGYQQFLKKKLKPVRLALTMPALLILMYDLNIKWTQSDLHESAWFYALRRCRGTGWMNNRPNNQVNRCFFNGNMSTILYTFTFVDILYALLFAFHGKYQNRSKPGSVYIFDNQELTCRVTHNKQFYSPTTLNPFTRLDYDWLFPKRGLLTEMWSLAITHGRAGRKQSV